MYHLLVLFSLLFLADGYQPESSILSISTEGSVELPADIIRFDINLNAEADTPEEAYNLHEKREQALVELLDKHQVEETDIDFQPVSISKSRRYNRPNEEVTTYQTSQLVSLTLENFDSYEKIQLGLIKNGFDNFGGHFLSSEEESGRSEALKKAIRIAKEKARLIAEEAGVKLGSIRKISYREHQQRPVPIQSQSFMRAESNSQLMKYNQTIILKESVQVDFEIVETEEL